MSDGRSPTSARPSSRRPSSTPSAPQISAGHALLQRYALAVLACAVFLLLELAAVATLHRRELTSVWELQRGTLWITPTGLATALVFGGLGYALHAQWWLSRTHRAAAVGLGVCIALIWGAVGYGVGGGRHLAAPGLRPGFAVMVGCSAGLAIFFAGPKLARWAATQPRKAAGLLAVAVLVIAIANRFVLPRLYPAFHWGLGACTLLMATWVPLTLDRAALLGGLLGRRALLKSSIFLGCALLAASRIVPAAQRLALFDNYRFLMLEHAPVLGRLVEAAARVAPPEGAAEADYGVCAEANGCGSSASKAGRQPGFDLSRRDILLVTVDALRADHIGAYGYGRPTTPNFDRLAAEGVLFERAYTATPHTSYAVTSLMTGKYMRPLLLQGAGADSDTWAELLRTYGYRTAAFYPPAIFFIDSTRFESFQTKNLGFEYAKVEFAEGSKRVAQVTDYLKEAPHGAPLFMWVHLFGPHEPYEAHPGHDFGSRDIDRYDSEIRAADQTLGEIVAAFRRQRPGAVVLTTADHGEEFGEHGGRYHGTTVYEEQLRVPFLVSAPGVLAPRRVKEVVQTVDILPTLLGGLDIPRPPRVRGRDLGPLLAGQRPEEAGFAYGETDEHALLARGALRLVCARRIGACKLYDLDKDPEQRRDASDEHALEQQKLRAELRDWGASHGRYESQGLRAEGKGFPAAILRGLSGDGDAAADVAMLLDDADPGIRRKAAEVLWQLRRKESAGALRLALGRDDDPDVRRYAALALTRLGEGAPLVLELLEAPELAMRRRAALALAESGDRRGLQLLIDEFRDGKFTDFSHARELLDAFAGLRAKEAVPALIPRLSDVRLRPFVAQTLALIGEESARMPLVKAFAEERYHSARVELSRAIVALGGRAEMAPALTRFMGVPDPLPNALEIALQARILAFVGGPSEKHMAQLKKDSELGARFRVVVPKGGNGQGARAVIRARCTATQQPENGRLVLGSAFHLERYDRQGKAIPQRKIPEIDARRALQLELPCDSQAREVHGSLPAGLSAKPGSSVEYVLFASRGVQLDAVAIVPLADELPPPPPEPWRPGKEGPAPEN